MDKIIMSAICLTAGERAEAHVGMQKIGTDDIADNGFTVEDLDMFLSKFQAIRPKVRYDLIRLDLCLEWDVTINGDLVDLDIRPASLLIIREGVDILLEEDDGHKKLFKELKPLDWDTKYYDTRRQKVLNKLARHNLVFDEKAQSPNYEEKQGRVYSYDDLSLLKKWYTRLPEVLGPVVQGLSVEGNHYYDVRKTGIGFHGDAERKKVIAASLGEWRELHYQWYYNLKPVGRKYEFKLYGGDMYIMSEKTTGYDWKRWKIYTLRHAAGRMDGPSKKYLTVKR